MFLYIIVLSTIVIFFEYSALSFAQTHDEVVLTENVAFDLYAKHLRPVINQSSPIGVNIKFHLMAINDLDEVKGEVKLLGFFSLNWTDQFLAWGALGTLKNGGNSITVSSAKVWLPKLVLGNPFAKFTDISQTESLVRISKTGVVEWSPGGLYQIACNVDTSYFPFDHQTCFMNILVWDYTSSEVNFQTVFNSVDLDYYEEHAVWELDDTFSQINKSAEPSQVTFTLKLGRRSYYFVVNILSPVLLLGILNTLVFLLPVDSGERVSFSVTMYLAFVVFLTIVGDNLPRNSNPLSLLSYFLLTMLCISALEIILTIFVVKIHHKSEDDHIPQLLTSIAYDLLCMCCRKAKIQPSTEINNAYIRDDSTDEFIDSKVSLRPQGLFIRQLTWKKIAEIVDWMCFFLCIGLHVLVTISFIVPLALQFST